MLSGIEKDLRVRDGCSIVPHPKADSWQRPLDVGHLDKRQFLKGQLNIFTLSEYDETGQSTKIQIGSYHSKGHMEIELSGACGKGTVILIWFHFIIRECKDARPVEVPRR